MLMLEIRVQIFISVCVTCVACWRSDPHQRPQFPEILIMLQNISDAPFICQEEFYSMQETWKKEIKVMLQEMGKKEFVSVVKII